MNRLRITIFLISILTGIALNAQNSPVGSPEVSFDVSPTGGATYGIPVEIPQGLPGMEPHIGISYNSQSGNSIAGWGCSITGVSVISRTVRDVFHDDASHGIDFTVDDAFSLDGQRLIRLSYEIGCDSAEYCLENNPFVKIIFHGLSGTDQMNTWFSVLYPDGTKSVYGYQSGQLGYYLSDGYKVLAWYVNQIENTVGNQVNYAYNTWGKYVYPASISYANSHVDFIYEVRPDTIESPLPGTKSLCGLRLKEITSCTDSAYTHNVYRTYHLSYTAEGDSSQCKYSRLQSVVVSNGYGETMKPITLDWSYLPDNSIEVYSPNVTPGLHDMGASDNSMSFFAADFNGDGLSDIAQMATVSLLNQNQKVINLFHANRSVTGEVSFTKTDQIRLTGGYVYQAWTGLYTSPMAMDVDGDGINELLIPFYVNSIDALECGYSIYKGATCIGSIRYTDMHVTSIDRTLWSAADYDNDGIGNALVIEKYPENGYYCGALLGGYTETTAFCRLFRFQLPQIPEHLFSADMNNDGMTDIVVFTGNTYRVFWNDGTWNSSGQTPVTPSYTSYTLPITQTHVWQGDFNGDGISDFLMGGLNSGNFYFGLGNGDGGLACNIAITLDIYDQIRDDDDKFCCVVTDFDRDGKNDVVISKAMCSPFDDIYSRTFTYWLQSDGKRLNTHGSSTSLSERDALAQYYMQGDFNGDGMAEMASYTTNLSENSNYGESPQLRLYGKTYANVAAGKIIAVTDGYDRKTRVTYKTMADPDVYSVGSATSFPVRNVMAPLPLVSRIEAGNGCAGVQTTRYAYEGLKVHSQGRGMMGMTAVSVTNQNTGMVKTTRISEWDSSSFLPTVQTVCQTVDGKTSSERTDYQCQSHRSPHAFFHHLQKVLSTDFDGDKVEQHYFYYTAANGGLFKYSKSFVDSPLSEETYYHYQKVGNVYLPDTVRTYTYNESTGFVSSTIKRYDAKCRLVKTVDHAETPLALTTDYTYDEYGNPLSSTTTGSGISTIVNTYQYDPTHRFMTRSLEQGYIETLYTYDRWGHKLTETDNTRSAYPQTTSYTYNHWGVLTSKRTPTGQPVNYTSGWGTTPYRRYYTYESGQFHTWVRTWYDDCGREVEREWPGAKNLMHKVLTTYNAKGEVTEKWNYRNNDLVKETFTYDAFGRVLSDVLSTGSSSTYSYDRRKKTCVVNGNTYTTIYAPNGQVVSSADPVSSVTYTYHPCGKPLSVTSDGTTVAMSYDEAGNQVSLSDPDAGTMTYTYDALGRVATQTDAKNVSTQYVYNTRGQLLRTVTGAVRTFYSYGSSTNNNGLLLTETRSGNTIYYTYDENGRITEKKNYIKNVGYRSVNYSYDSLHGNLSQIQYPGDVWADYLYDERGNHIETLVNDSSVWKLNTLTATTEEALLGSTLRYTHVNDASGRTTSQSWIRQADSQTVHAMGYAYNNATGNLTSRAGMFPSEEHFSYDAIDRLTNIQRGGDEQSIVYTPNGNIEYRSEMGFYNYESNKPHAVTGVENTGGLIPEVTQQTSYDSFGKISEITDSATNSRMLFYYGPDGERWKTELFQNEALKRTTCYMGDYEEITENDTVRQFYYLDGGALYVRKTGQPDQLYYVLADNLGSAVKIVDKQGAEVFSATYDAWGLQTVLRNDIGFLRGYTGHEMLPEFGLINMNGRLYDPLLGRFLSTDNYVQLPDFSQSFNRYSYCLNNPLKFTDPSGEFIDIIISAAVAGYTNWILNRCQWNASGLESFLVAAISNCANSMVASGINVALAGGSFWKGAAGLANGVSSTGFLSGAASGAGAGFVAGFISGAGASWLEGNSFRKGLLDGLALGSLEALGSGIVSGITGGFDAMRNHTNFWTGKGNFDMTGAMACQGLTPKELNIGDKIKAKYVGRFEGQRVFESSNLGSLAEEEIVGFTLPDIGIFVGDGAFSSGEKRGLAMMQHEFGHVLQYRRVGADFYYRVIAKESAMNCGDIWPYNGISHSEYWTETWANYLSKQYFGDRWLGMEKRIKKRTAFYYPSKNISMPFLLRKVLIPF